MRTLRFGVVRAAPVLLIVLTLVSCGPGRNQFAPACPVPGVMKPLAEMDRYRAGSRDMRELIIHARIVNITGKCEAGDDANTVVAVAQVVFELTRGPGMEGRTYALPLFVAVTDADAIRDKGMYAVSIEFPPNVDTARALSQVVRMELPVTPQKSAAAYGIIAGFQLTPEEVAAMRQTKRR